MNMEMEFLGKDDNCGEQIKLHELHTRLSNKMYFINLSPNECFLFLDFTITYASFICFRYNKRQFIDCRIKENYR